MKLKQPGTYGQRELPWASELLGYNTDPKYTIHDYACLITSFGNYVGMNPGEVNELLKTNNGFVKGSGNFVWSKSIILGLNQTYLSPRYEGLVTSQGLQKIKDCLDQGYPLICEIDFNPATVKPEQHFVLVNAYDGNDIGCYDPWTNQQISLDLYGGSARAIIQFRSYDKILEKEDGVPKVTIGVAEYDELKRQSDIAMKIATKLNVALSDAVIMPEIDKLITYEDSVVQKDKQLTDAQIKIGQFQKDVETKGEQIETMKKQVETLTNNIETIGKQNETMSGELKILKEQCQQPVLSGFKKWLYDWIVGRR
jgi:chaperonin cofactor prefoldin